MPVEAPAQPAYEAAPPPPEPVDYASRYGGIGATTDPEGDLPAVDAAVGLPPPDVTSTTTTSDFESRYADIGTVPGTEATAAELDPTPTPEPTPLPEFADRYADIGSTPAASKALEETQQPVEPTFVIQSAAQIEAGDVKLVRERGPLVPIPKAEITQEEPILTKGAKATYNTVAGFVEGMTSADGLNMLLNPVVGIAGLGAMIPELVNKVRTAEKTPANSPERWQAGADVAGFLAIPAVVHGISKLRTPVKPVESPEPAPATVTPEVLTPQTETARVAPEPAVPQAIENMVKSTFPEGTTVEFNSIDGTPQQGKISYQDGYLRIGDTTVPYKQSLISDLNLRRPGTIDISAEIVSQPAIGGGEILTETAVPQGAADLPDSPPTIGQRVQVLGEKSDRRYGFGTVTRFVGDKIGVEVRGKEIFAKPDRIRTEAGADLPENLPRAREAVPAANESASGAVTKHVVNKVRGHYTEGYSPSKLMAENGLDKQTFDDILSGKYGRGKWGDNTLAETISEPAPGPVVTSTKNAVTLEERYAIKPEGAEPLSPGPGAASAEEPLPKSEPRAFAERFQDDAAIAQEIRDAAGNRFYEPISNKVTMENATDVVQDRGIPESINMLKDEANGLDFRVRSAMGQFIIKRLNEGYRALKESAPADAELFLNQTADLAEWQQEYGTRLGQGVQSFAMWSRITPEGKLLSLKRQIQTVRDKFTQENGDQVKAVIAAANTGKIDALRQLAKKNPIARKLKNQFKDLIEASQPQLLTEDGFYQVAGERLGIPTFSPKIAADVLKLAHEIEAAPEGMPRDKATLELSKYIANLKGFDAKDVPLGIYYGNMLSGYNTQFVNALDTFLNVSSEITGLAVTNPKAAMRIYGGLLRGFGEGRLDALLALTEGRMITDGKWLEVPKLMEVARFGEKGGVPIRVTGTGSRLIKAASESKAAYPLRGWKYVTRLMAASDAIMFRGAKEARMALLADRLARGEGLRGRALTNRVNEILGLDEPALRSAQEQARDEGFTGTKAKVRAAELREMSRPKEASADAADFAGEATYNYEPHGVGGFFADLAAKASTKFPVLKAFVPFTRIVANVTNRGLNYTPVGFKRAFYGYSGEAAPLGDARTAMLARATIGTVGGLSLLALQEGGALEINGQGPSDNERRKQLQNAGWKPYSLKIGDHYFSYVYTPVGLWLSILGNMTDSYRYNELSQQDAFTRAGYAISRIGGTVFNQSFLSGLSGLFRALSGSPGDTIASVKQTLSSTFGSFTTPTILRDIYRLFDPKVYQTTSIVGDLLKNTPFAAAVNKPALNAFGESVSYPSNRFVSEVKDDAAWRFVVEKGLRVPVPDKYSQVPDGDGGKRRITPDEYYRYLHDSGQQIKALVLDKRFDWATLDHDEAQKELNAESERIRDQVKRELFQ